MKFELVDPDEEQAIVDDGRGTEEAEPLPRGVDPGLARASARTRARLRDDLATLGASLNRLNEHIQIAQRRELDEAPAAPPPPTSFRAGAFSRPGAP
ncbi:MULTISPECIES: hypothetical protein [unclassified Nocardiopsis]|uniref:hypothetical protein n=1 Tax=unclassified Nocardiopsis TaxID=2649073 RepID=UPI00135A21B5|nr:MULTISPECIES: hypothetical protein [unclassified Nocardiopsis]